MDVLPLEIQTLILHKIETPARFCYREVCKIWSQLISKRVITFGDLAGLKLLNVISLLNEERIKSYYCGHIEHYSYDELYRKCKKRGFKRYDESNIELVLIVEDRLSEGPRIIALIADSKCSISSTYVNWRIYELTNKIIFPFKSRNYGTIEVFPEYDSILESREFDFDDHRKSGTYLTIKAGEKKVTLGIYYCDIDYPKVTYKID